MAAQYIIKGEWASIGRCLRRRWGALIILTSCGICRCEVYVIEDTWSRADCRLIFSPRWLSKSLLSSSRPDYAPNCAARCSRQCHTNRRQPHKRREPRHRLSPPCRPRETSRSMAHNTREFRHVGETLHEQSRLRSNAAEPPRNDNGPIGLPAELPTEV